MVQTKRDGSDNASQSELTSNLQQEVIEMKEAVGEVVDEERMTDKVEDLRLSLDNLSSDVENWKARQKGDLLEALESIKYQVEEIEKSGMGLPRA